MLLTGEKLGVKIRDRVLFENVSVSVDSGASLAIVGPSGSGKTTLLNCLGLIQRPSEGCIVIDGRNYRNRAKRDVLRFWKTSAAFIYQDSGVIDEESVLYNVTLKRAMPFDRNDAGVGEALSKVGLSGREKEKASVLSGGEKQRLGLARAIYKKASILFADEPTASLDERSRSLVRNLLLERAEAGAIVIIATHDLDLAKSCSSTLDLGYRFQ